MGIRQKIQIWKSVFSCDILVYQPGKVGSTTVVDALTEADTTLNVIHIHSFGLDRCYFIKGYNSYFILNRMLAFVAGRLIGFYRRSLRKPLIVLVPLRSERKRRESVFRGFFEILVGKSVKQRWFKSLYKKDKESFLNAMRDQFLQTRPYERWARNELSAFAMRGVEITHDANTWSHRVQGYGIDIISFPISAFQEISRDALKIEIDENKKSNTSSEKWCAELFDKETNPHL